MRSSPIRNRLVLLMLSVLVLAGAAACARSVRAASESAAPLAGGPPASDAVARGKWLVETLACAYCHTPKLADGRYDPAFAFAGHKADDPFPAWDDSLYTRGYGMLVSTSGTAFA